MTTYHDAWATILSWLYVRLIVYFAVAAGAAALFLLAATGYELYLLSQLGQYHP